MTERARLEQVAPVLPARDVGRLREFYCGKLGFDLAFIDQSTDQDDPKYLGVRRDGVELHIQWHHDTAEDPVLPVLLRFIVGDVDGLFAEFEPQGVFHHNTRLRNTAWGTREFGVYDPDGNGLIFFRDLKSGEAPDAD